MAISSASSLLQKMRAAGVAGEAGDRPAPQRSIDMDRAAGDHLGARGDRSDDNHIALGVHDALAGADRVFPKKGFWGAAFVKRGEKRGQRHLPSFSGNSFGADPGSRVGQRSGSRRLRGAGRIVAGDDAGLPPAQEQRRHREIEPRRLGAFDAHHLDIALGEILQKLRDPLLARLQDRKVENDWPAEEKPRRTVEPPIEFGEPVGQWAAPAPEPSRDKCGHETLWNDGDWQRLSRVRL